MICIRADANKTIATGHVMRCLSIAEALREVGEDVIFAMADEEGAYLPKERGFETFILHSDYSDMEGELPAFLAFIRQSNIKAVLLDSYQVTKHYMEAVLEQTKLVYLDDIDAFPYPCDLLINYAASAEDATYTTYRKESTCLLGTDYIPLRSQFVAQKAHMFSEKVQNVLLLSGGTDPCGILPVMADRLREQYQGTITIITSSLNERREELLTRAKADEALQVYFDVKNMAEHMQKADVCITAGGSTTYELCATGTPYITYTLADNQLPSVRKMAELGMTAYAGDVRENLDKVINSSLIHFEDYQSQRYREAVSQKLQNFVDGNGAKRIAQRIIALY